MQLTAKELAEKIGATLIGDPQSVVTKLCDPQDAATAGSVVLMLGKNPAKKLRGEQPTVAILEQDDPGITATKLITTRGKLILIDLLNIFYPSEQRITAPFISERATVAQSASLGKNVTIHPGVVIGTNCTIGDGTIVYANAVIYDNCIIGKQCIIHSNSVIGADGFGFIFDDNRHQKIPQVGNVLIEDNVEIGAGTTIDRATLKSTVIGSGTKIDNKVQVGHNVSIGKNCILVGACNIGGSAKLEDNVVLAGCAAVVNGITVGKGSIISAYTVVTKDTKPGSKLYATPAGVDYRKAMKSRSLINKLPEFFKRLKELSE